MNLILFLKPGIGLDYNGIFQFFKPSCKDFVFEQALSSFFIIYPIVKS